MEVLTDSELHEKSPLTTEVTAEKAEPRVAPSGETEQKSEAPPHEIKEFEIDIHQAAECSEITLLKPKEIQPLSIIRPVDDMPDLSHKSPVIALDQDQSGLEGDLSLPSSPWRTPIFSPSGQDPIVVQPEVETVEGSRDGVGFWQSDKPQKTSPTSPCKDQGLSVESNEPDHLPAFMGELQDVGGVLAVNIEPTLHDPPLAPVTSPNLSMLQPQTSSSESSSTLQDIPVPANLQELKIKHAFALSPAQCQTCVVGFCSVTLMLEHLSTLPKKKLHDCQVCVKGSVEREGLECHLNCHVQSTCRICHQVSASSASLTRHIRGHRRKGELTRETYLAMHSLHTKKMHTKTIKKLFTLIKNRTANKPEYSCNLCGKKFNQKHKLTRHESYIHMVPKSFPCSFCDKAFDRLGLLREHYQFWHYNHLNFDFEASFKSNEGDATAKLSASQDDYENLTEQYRFIIPTHKTRKRAKKCGQQISSQSPDRVEEGDKEKGLDQICSLEEHELSYKKSTFQCTICYKSFAPLRALLAHIQTHHTDEEENDAEDIRKEKQQPAEINTITTFSCSICHRECGSFMELDQHYKMIHNRLPPLSLTPSNHLEDQVLIPLGEKPVAHVGISEEAMGKKYTCTRCSKECSSEGEFISHKQYVCSTFRCTKCSCFFPTKHHLEEHELTHKKTTFQCTTGSKTFSALRALLGHIQTPDQDSKERAAEEGSKEMQDKTENTCSCTICHRKCDSFMELQQHYKMIHNCLAPSLTPSNHFPTQSKSFSPLQILLGHNQSHDQKVTLKNMNLQEHKLTYEKEIQCTNNSKSFSPLQVLLGHNQSHNHSGEESATDDGWEETEETAGMNFSCSICFRKCDSLMEFQQHYKTIHNQLSPLYSTQSETMPDTRSRCRDGYKVVCLRGNFETQEQMVVCCAMCGGRYASVSEHTVHMKDAHPTEYLTCPMVHKCYLVQQPLEAAPL